MNARASLERWLTRAVLHVPEGGATLDRIVVRHASGGAKSPEVESIKVADPTELSAAKLAARLYEAAEHDAEGLGGFVQRYVAHAYYGQSREPECGRCVFAVHREEEMGANPLDSEPANATGLVAQALRHNEANARITAGATQVVVGQMTRLIEMQASRITELENKLQEAREASDELTLQREEAKRQAEKEDRRDKVLFESLQTLAPIVVAKLAAQAGGGAPQLPPAAKDLVVNRLLGSVTQEQFTQLQAILKPDQMALFIAAYESHILDKEAPAPPAAPLAKVNGHGGQALTMAKKLVFDRPARVRIFREGAFWVAQALVQTPTGVVGLQAAVSEKRVLKFLKRRAKRRTGEAVSAGLFDTLKKAARTVSRATAISKVMKAAKAINPVQLAAKLVPAPIKRAAEGAAVKLLGAAMGGDAKAKKAIKALRAVAKQADPTSKAAAAYRTLGRVAKRMVRGDLRGVARTVKQAALDEAAPINAVVETLESQINRLPSPLNVSARAVLQTFPGVSAAYAVHAATEAWKQGKLFTPQGLVSAASALPGQPGAWAQAARPLVGAATAGRRSRNRYPLGYVAGVLLWPRFSKYSRSASGIESTTTT